MKYLKHYCAPPSLAITAALAFATPGAGLAADLTVDTATDYTQTGSSFDNIYVNADFSLGTAETRGAFTLNNGKKIFLPGTDNGNATFTFKNGQMATGNSTSGFNIGYGDSGHTGSGLIVVSNIDSYNSGQKMSKLGLVQIGDKATASGGQVDFLRIDAGLLEVSGTQNGSWRRAGVSKIANYRTDSVPARILFTGDGGALCPNQNQASQFFLCDAASSVTAVEGDGADIVFMTGQWLENSSKTMTKVIPLIDTASAGILRFQGDCDVVFHNHNAGTVADDTQYGFSLGLGTNHVVWAQTGDIVVSNACTLLTAADYALPNGAQTARVVFRDKDGTSEPALDLCGTTQRANGVVSEIAASDALRGVVTNSSAAAATLVLGADGADCALKVGRVCGGVTVRKAGAGTLDLASPSLEALEAVGGVVAVSNAAVTVDTLLVDGGTLEIVGGTVTVASSVTVRNGGKVLAIDGGSLVNNGTLAADGPGWYAMAFDGDGEISGGAAGTCAIAIRSGTTVVYDSDQDSKFWRLVIRDTSSDTTTLNVIEKNGSVSTVAGTTNVNVALQKFHLFPTASGTPENANRLNVMSSEAAVGTAASALAAGQCVSARPYLDAGAILSYATATETGTQITTDALVAGVLGNLSAWQRNTVFANGALSESDSASWETVSMRLPDDAAPVRGYAYAVSGYGKYGVNPTSFKVECSADGEEWTTKADVSGAYNGASRSPQGYWYWKTNDPQEIWPLTNNVHGAFSTYGAVSVASGATLDLTGIPAANVAVNAVEYDWSAGGGAIAGFVPATTGALYLVNVPDGTNVENVALSLDLGGAAAQALPDWAVYVNGALASQYSLRITPQGRFVIRSGGTVISFR